MECNNLDRKAKRISRGVSALYVDIPAEVIG